MARYLILLILFFFLTSVAYAGDTHQRKQSHRVAYVVADASGNPVTDQTIRLQVIRASDDSVFDFSDNTFKQSGWTTRYVTMNYDNKGEYYAMTLTIDSAALVSGDYVFIISNDSALYADQQVEVVTFGETHDLIRMHR